MTVVSRLPWRQAVADMLAGHHGRPVIAASSRQHDESDPFAGVEPPYQVVLSIDGGGLTGPPLGDAHADADLVFQVDSVGVDEDQAEMMGDMGRQAMLARAGGVHVALLIPPAGWAVMWRDIVGGPAAAVAQGQPPNQLWVCQDRYRLHVTPTG